MSTRPRVVVDCNCHTGENPMWHPMEKRLYWLDIPAGRIWRYDPATGETDHFDQGCAIGGFTMQPDGALLLFMARGAVKVWREDTLETVIDELPDEVNNRFNDVIADPEGRVYCGTMTTPERPARLYRLDTDGSITQLLDGIGTSNGMGFTRDGRQFYYTDTRAYQIYIFDYDRATGDITNQRTFVKVEDGRGRPDGMTVDGEGCVWGARWDGFGIARYAPDGSEIAWYDIPARNVSSLTFGGEDYADIYITTAAADKPEENGRDAGSLFHMNCGVRGGPEFVSRCGS